MIHTLLPLNMCVVTYELARGRPYSKLEELVLRSVNQAEPSAGHTFAELRTVFVVHDRLLTEALVTLIQEGWIAIAQVGHEMHYLITDEGRLTVSRGRRPGNLRVRTKHVRIVRERLTGQLSRASDVALVNSWELRRATKRTVWRETLRPRLIRTKINGGEAERLLPRPDKDQEWIRWIDSTVQVSQDMHYLPLRVDLESATVNGLPPQWYYLSDMIIREVTERVEEFTNDPEFQQGLQELAGRMPVVDQRFGHGIDTLASDETAAALSVDSYAATSLGYGDVAWMAGDSKRMADSCLSASTTNVLMVCGRLDITGALAVRDKLVRLRGQGVHVDLLWSNDERECSAREVLGILDAARGSGLSLGKATYSRRPWEFAADVLLVAADPHPVAVLGCGVSSGDCGMEATLSPAVRITDRDILASLARLCAGWWEEHHGDEVTLPSYRWKHLAEKWAGERMLSPAHPAGKEAPCCPGRSSDDSFGEILLLSEHQLAVVRQRVVFDSSAHYLISSGGLPVVFGAGSGHKATSVELTASGGWTAYTRADSGWVESDGRDLPPPSPSSHRILASDRQWLVECPPNGRLSFLVTGHAGKHGWDRIIGKADAFTAVRPVSSYDR